MTDIAGKVHAIVASVASRPLAEISDTQKLHEDLGIDSLDRVDLIILTEVELGFEIPDAEVDRLQTVGDLVALVERLA